MGDIGDILEKVRTAMRIKSSVLDGELMDEIVACQIDLNLAGVNKTDLNDKLVMEAVKLYCKAKHDFGGQGERYERSYENLKRSLALSTKYGEKGNEG